MFKKARSLMVSILIGGLMMSGAVNAATIPEKYSGN